MIYPINEIFYSLKGEGVWTGTPMLFVRLAGCNLSCKFCDTADIVSASMDSNEILKALKALSIETQHVVITGGEPMIRDLSPLLRRLKSAGYILHLETNGSRTVWSQQATLFDWIAVSPKYVDDLSQQVISEADEIKFLCGSDGWEEIIDGVIDQYSYLIASHHPTLYLMPVAKSIKEGDRSITDLIDENVQMAKQYCLKHPDFTFCIQLHKVLGIP